ncbi:anti-sigma factor family protein [Sphingomicrobium clamense]|uniref:Anti-sigma factor n=1 Tax=Sphingomicrobium clamense TaxID=2851013 RepID=A0ABS6V7Z3_9SPHN|nr:hypothetical protein [Sphingomicrobium sp. B8]MBW0145694.1 hypothetical protein [Sphingomicrobium sp. B8]
MTEEEEFFAWLDGELEGEAAAAVAARVAADPELKQLAEQHRTMTEDLRAAFDPIMTELPAPEAVLTFPSMAANDNSHWFRFGGMAASLAFALFLGILIGQPGEGLVVTSTDGRLIAASALSDTLDNQLASDEQGAIRVGVSFINTDGHYCRSFAAPEAEGVACRIEGGWQLEGLFAGKGESGEYRMAAGTGRHIAELIDALIVGEPLDAESEAEAQRREWQIPPRP